MMNLTIHPTIPYVMGLQSFYGKGPHPLAWGGSWVTHGKLTTSDISNCINYLCYNDQQYALICTTHLFYALAPTCFSSSLPSPGRILDPSELLEIQIEWVEYHIICGYVTGVPDCHGSVEPRQSGTQVT
jgi:hypothetical protein